MLHNFLSSNRDELIRRCIDKVAKRPKRNATEKQLRNGIPIGNTVVFSAHGLSKAVQAEADARGLRSAYDWEIIDVLLHSSINVHMVGDIRQAVLATNPRSSNNAKYSYEGAIDWARKRQSQGLLEIFESVTTWRCHPSIAKFSDSIFDPSWKFG